MHLTFLADSLALLKEGMRIESNRAMMDITTSNSTSVNPFGATFLGENVFLIIIRKLLLHNISIT
jgi:hypothetical protein